MVLSRKLNVLIIICTFQLNGRLQQGRAFMILHHTEFVHYEHRPYGQSLIEYELRANVEHLTVSN